MLHCLHSNIKHTDDASVTHYSVSYTFFHAYEKHQPGIICLHIPRRIQVLIDKHFLPCTASTMEFVQDFFTDIFSWSVFPASMLRQLEYLLVQECGVTHVVDPCCGNAFHAFLLRTFTQLTVAASDVQLEEEAWTSMEVLDAREAVALVETPESTALLLSWVDYQELGMDLVHKFQGRIVISVGNYDEASPDYVALLHRRFLLLRAFVLHMPWNRTERVNVYIKK